MDVINGSASCFSVSESRKLHEAQAEFESRRCSHLCSLVFGVVFVVISSVVFWLGSDQNIDDLLILASIVLVFGFVLLSLSLLLLTRGYFRAKAADTKVSNKTTFVTKTKPANPTPLPKEDTVVTQSDVSVRGVTSPLAASSLVNEKQLYGEEAVKHEDIEKFQTALKQHQASVSPSHEARQKSRAIIKLGPHKSDLASQNVVSEPADDNSDDVIIIHDAHIALPKPDASWDETESTNKSNNNATKISDAVYFEQGRLPGTPDIPNDVTESVAEEEVPQAFFYVDPGKDSTTTSL